MNEDNKNIQAEETEQITESTSNQKSLTKTIIEFLSVIATSIVAIMFIFTFVFRIVGVSGPSMMNTLHDGDWLVVSAFITEPERGDIVIITQPNALTNDSNGESTPIVKRVIAVGGDTIDIDFATATVKVNGKVIDEPYLGSATINAPAEGGWEYPLTLKEGQVFVMGDNRQHSSDSRSPAIGLIDEDYILGQVLFRFSPITDFKFFGDYDYE